jgi:YidC/Oxa1 family membrane protein insertase
VKNDSRNFILFAVIAALLLFGWPMVVNQLFPTAKPPVTKIEAGQTKVIPNPGADPAADSPAAIRSRDVVLRESPRVAIETPTLSGSINLKGARIDDLVLRRYRETIAQDAPPIRLLSPSGAPAAYFAGFGWSGQNLAAPDANTVWRASGTRLAPGAPVTLTTTIGSVRYAIELAVDEGYMFTVRQRVGNAGTRPVAAAPYGYLSRQGTSKDVDAWTLHVGPIAAHNGGVPYDAVDYDTIKEDGPQTYATRGGWIGFTDIYWLTALIPDQGAQSELKFRSGAGEVFQADTRSAEARVLQPGQAITTSSRFFAGAKEVDRLDAYQDEGVMLFGKAIDWGWFEVIEKPIFDYLHWLFELVGNFGVAIILLTLTVRLIMFPIAQRQFASMASMRAIQPKMKALQERYKDDKPRLQQEMMGLYKTEKVNPLAGCAPTLLQIPIFYALYKVLMLTIEMRHQPFVAWIKDLSAPDPLTPLNLFGLLAFTPPSFIAIGVIPILLGISMYFQFKLNPAPMDEVQKQIFAIMPWMLMFVMAPFAVGLQVYWITSNVLTILQQQWLYSRHPALKTAPAK